MMRFYENITLLCGPTAKLRAAKSSAVWSMLDEGDVKGFPMPPVIGPLDLALPESLFSKQWKDNNRKKLYQHNSVKK